MSLREFWRKLTRRRVEDNEFDTRQPRDNRSDVPEVSKWVPRPTDQDKPKY
jgi:hypothetical protein